MSIHIGIRDPRATGVLRHSARNRTDERKSLEKLSSGKRINRAADDAAALAIATEMGAVLRGLEQGMENVYDGLSMVQTADGGLDATTDQLHRMRELAVSAASDVLGPDQRQAIQAEYEALQGEIDHTAASVEFNGRKVLDGSAGVIEVASGQDGESAAEAVALDFSRNMDAESLGLAGTRLDGPDGENARSAIDDIDSALAAVSSQRADYGGVSNRLVSANQGLAVAAENTYASRSRIMDTDYARQTAELMRQQILAQAGDAVTAQGQLIPSSVLSLLN